MSDLRILDAINIYQLSDTRRGHLPPGWDADYRQRYTTLANNVADLLVALNGRNKIVYGPLPGDTWGEQAGEGDDIRITINRTKLEPEWDSVRYANPVNQGKVMGTSLLLVHEAAHAAHPRSVTVLLESEMIARTLEQTYFKESKKGLPPYTSMVTRKQHTPALGALVPPWQADERRYDAGQLVDYLLIDLDYSEGMTADWVERSLDWWKGIRNRWRRTRGYYLKLLAGSRTMTSRRQERILEILESFISPVDWQTAQGIVAPPRWLEARDVENIRKALAWNGRTAQQAWANRIRIVQNRIRENLGVSATARR